ncbi:MAG: hypothetical protein AAFQ52_02510 [Chloroflexota bacterium]
MTDIMNELTQLEAERTELEQQKQDAIASGNDSLFSQAVDRLRFIVARVSQLNKTAEQIRAEQALDADKQRYIEMTKQVHAYYTERAEQDKRIKELQAELSTLKEAYNNAHHNTHPLRNNRTKLRVVLMRQDKEWVADIDSQHTVKGFM